MSTDTTIATTPIQRLTRDIASASVTLSEAEVRFLVDTYYQQQEQRIRSDGQIRSIQQNPIETVDDKTGEVAKAIEPHSVLQWFATQTETLEGQIKRALGKYVESHPVGEWLVSVHGIGPVIAAGLLAHIDINKAPTVGHIWRFAGLDPTVTWAPKTKRPWNASLKVICWKAGESFVKFHNHEKCVYGHIWAKQKAVYIERNERGDYAEKAAATLLAKKYRKETEAYKAYSVGKYPPGRIHAMARRYAVKIFLAHLHGEMCRRILNIEPPMPYAIAHLGHAHLIKP